MTAVSVIGTGPAGAIHIEAARALGFNVVAVSNKSGNDELARQLDVRITSVADAIDAAQILVIATPPSTHEAIVALADTHVDAMLVESPIAATVRAAYSIAMAATPVMTGANLLHGPAGTVLRRRISSLIEPHRLHGSFQTPKPTWGAHGSSGFGGGALVSIGGLVLPVMLALAGEPVAAVSAQLHGTNGVDEQAHLTLELESGRIVTLEIEWGRDNPRWDIEAADEHHAVRGQLMPKPAVEFDGEAVAIDTSANSNAIVDSGAVRQLQRLSQTVQSRSAVWPDGWVGYGATMVMVAAAQSAGSNGTRISMTEVDLDRTPAELWAGSV